MQDLTQMSNEQLWELFPIVLEPHNPAWKMWYEQEAEQVCRAVGRQNVLRLSHIGSTSVPGLLAKPTVDILLEISEETALEEMLAGLEHAGYLYAPQPQKPAPHMMLMKGYTLQGFAPKVFHLHVRYLADQDELYFRDYLRAHPETAAEYAALKQRLGQRFRHDRDAYTDAKGAFVAEITQLARAAFPGRYLPETARR